VVFPDRFANHILPDRLHKLSVSFTVSDKNGSLGGTGLNISYNLRLLGGIPLLVTAIGKDGKEFLEHLESIGISTEYIVQDTELDSACCHLITDKDNNQINYYYPGPTERAGSISLKGIKEEFPLAIISPSTRDVMLKQLRECAALGGVVTIFDPGQQITSFSREDLREAICASDFIFGNDYEIGLLEEHSGWRKEDILMAGKIIITTRGAKGSGMEYLYQDKPIEVEACRNITVVDPTGAGDAFRAGFIIGYLRGYRCDICLQLGSVAASFAVETQGTQNHRFDPATFIARYEENYGKFPLSLAVEWESGIPVPLVRK
jgi:adenosine kinase